MDMQGNTRRSNHLNKGTSLGVVTDVNGKFTLEIPQMDGVVLVVSFVGYETRYVALGNEQKRTNDQIKEKTLTEMDEVVVTGYGKYVKKVSREVVSAYRKNNS